MSGPVKIIECPRDAWQGLQEPVPTDLKVSYLNALISAGFKHIDAVSFVSSKAVPQMADSEEVIKALRCMGSFSSEPRVAPTKVGTSNVFGAGSGSIRQNPTDSIKLRASSSVRTAFPLRRHFSRRSSMSSVSVIKTSYQLSAF